MNVISSAGVKLKLQSVLWINALSFRLIISNGSYLIFFSFNSFNDRETNLQESGYIYCKQGHLKLVLKEIIVQKKFSPLLFILCGVTQRNVIFSFSLASLPYSYNFILMNFM